MSVAERSWTGWFGSTTFFLPNVTENSDSSSIGKRSQSMVHGVCAGPSHTALRAFMIRATEERFISRCPTNRAVFSGCA